MPKCKICGLKFKYVMNHARQKHGIPKKEYYDKYIKKKNEGICKLKGCNNTTKFYGNKGYAECCCNSHAQLLPKTRNKLKKTKLERYGNENYSNRKKAKNTCLKLYGDPYYNNRDKCAEKLLSRSKKEKEDWILKVKKAWDSKSKDEKKLIGENRHKTKLKKGSYKQAVKNSKKTLKKKYNITNAYQLPKSINNRRKAFKNNLDKILDKREKTIKSKYGSKKVYLDNMVKKNLKTRLKNGTRIDYRKLPKYKRYRKKVIVLTKQNVKLKYSKEKLKLRGRCGYKKAHQIDHRFSILEGFKNNIPVEIIAHPCNLKLIQWKDNNIKRDSCSITKTKLYKLVKSTKKYKNLYK